MGHLICFWLPWAVSAAHAADVQRTPRELIQYVEDAQKLGLKENDIRQNAVTAGWNREMVGEALAIVRYLNELPRTLRAVALWQKSRRGSHRRWGPQAIGSGPATCKPYAFAARPWELVKTESVDVMDAVGAAIRVDTRGREVMRILPRVNEDVNEEWISDKTATSSMGLRAQRLDAPYVRENNRLRQATWSEAFAMIAEQVKSTPPAISGRLPEILPRSRNVRAQGFDDAIGRHEH